ncbi:MAG: MFS transporter [Candidatus Methylacidiphilales bacterium]|nr:MFS transporter [Candidatus Methylacidiphilales bacterium]
MIITGKKSVPYSWFLIIALPVCALRFADSALGISFVFSLKKYADNPALLNLIISLPSFLALVIGPVVGYVSDHIWTRFGRRKPFLVASWGGMALSCFLLPLMPNFWTLVAAYIAYNLFKELGSVYEPLRQEVVPPHQRGRAGATFEWFANITNMLFFFVALGRFDDVRFMAGFQIDGEHAVYWSGALLLAMVALLIVLAIKENKPSETSGSGRLTLGNLLKGLFDRDLWPVYILVFGQALLNSGLGPLGTLVSVELFGFSKQDMGNNVVVGGLINVFIIGFLGLIADRLNRLRAYQVLIGLALLVKILFYVYIEFILPDKRATVIESIAFGEVLSIIGILTGLIYVPLAYEYVVRDKMGTFFAGSAMVTRITTIITTNTVGLFVWGYSLAFQPPAGEAVRVVLEQPASKADINELLHRVTWTLPGQDQPVSPGSIHAASWRASGPLEEPARCWEIRVSNPGSEALASERENLMREGAQLRTLANPRQDGRIAAIEARIGEINSELALRSADFEKQIRKALSLRLINENGAVRNCSQVPVRLITLAVLERPSGQKTEALLNDLRTANPALIDLRLAFDGKNYQIILAVQDNETTNETWAALVSRRMAVRQKGVLPPQPEVIRTSATSAFSLEVQTIEEPLEIHASPITSIVNGLMGFFNKAPPIDRRLQALGRNLRDPENLPFVRVTDVEGPFHAMRVLVVPGAVQNASLGSGNSLTSEGVAFLEKCVSQAAGQRLTVPKPVLLSSYQPMKYDYMAGYLMMFMLGFIGLWISFYFVKMERRGEIRKLGLLEAEKNTD